MGVGSKVVLKYNEDDPMYKSGRIQSVTKTKIGNKAGLLATVEWDASEEEPNGFIEDEWLDNLKEIGTINQFGGYTGPVVIEEASEELKDAIEKAFGWKLGMKEESEEKEVN
jgi:hypothetical protein